VAGEEKDTTGDIEKSKEARISLQVHPNAARNEIVSFNSGVLGVKIAAPPVQGKANKELIAFLSEVTGVSKSHISILKGGAARHKLVCIKGLSREEVIGRLSSSGEAPGKQSHR
jgi:uncharacterized protein (TIGR00251 family)